MMRTYEREEYNMANNNEQKAIRFVESIKEHAVVTLDHIAKEEPNVSPLVYEGRKEKAETILHMIAELEQYRAIGTLEEVKDAKEKQTPKEITTTEEIVYCKDCVHFRSSHCEIWDRVVGTHDFCSNGRTKGTSADAWKADRIRKAKEKEEML